MSAKPIPRGTNADVRAVLERAIADGCRVSTTRGGHLKVTLPDGRAVFTSSTPTRVKGAVAQLRSNLRRWGVAV